MIDEDRYMAAAHAIQTAVAVQIAHLGDNEAGADHKHLRTGLNMVMADHGSLAALLIRLGIITEAQYNEAIVEGTEAEAERMKLDTRRKCGLPDNVNFK